MTARDERAGEEESYKTTKDYLEQTWDRFWTYHNHKETSAWAGVVAVLLFAAIVLRSPFAHGAPFSGVVALGIVAVGLGSTFYVHRQYRLRAMAAAINAACSALLVKIASRDASLLKETATWALPNDPAELFPHYLPTFLIEEAKRQPEAKYLGLGIRSAIGVSLEAMLAGLNIHRSKERPPSVVKIKELEGLAYVLILAATIAPLLAVFISAGGQ